MSVLIEEAKSLRTEGKTFKEIAVSLDCSEGYLRKRLAGFHKSLDNAAEVRAELEKIQVIVNSLLKRV